MQKKGKISTKKSQDLKKPIKYPMDWALTKYLPKVYQRMEYTPWELRQKFSQYVERSDKYNEEITIAWFSVFASIARDYLYSNTNKSQESKDIIENIMSVFEYRYVQKLARSWNIPYLMNNRFKWSWESLSKSEDKVNINPTVKQILDKIIKKPNGDKQWW